MNAPLMAAVGIAAVGFLCMVVALLQGQRAASLRSDADARDKQTGERIRGILLVAQELALASRESTTAVYARLDRAVRDRCPSVDVMAVFMPDGDTYTCEYATGSRLEDYVGRVRIGRSENSAIARAARDDRPVILERDGAAPLHRADVCAIAVPLALDERERAVVYFAAAEAPAPDYRDVRELVAQAAPPLMNALERQTLERSANYDILTGLLKKDQLQPRLQEEVRLAAQRSPGTLTLVFVDLDNFKAWNDTHGHLAGDRLLKQIGDILAAHGLSEHDLCVRNGGDEFVVGFVGDRSSAIEQATRIGIAILRADRSRLVPDGDTKGVEVTSSIGLASFPLEAQTVEDLVAAADRQMYRAKNNGKNRLAFCALGGEEQLVSFDELDRRDSYTRPAADRRDFGPGPRRFAAAGQQEAG